MPAIGVCVLGIVDALPSAAYAGFFGVIHDAILARFNHARAKRKNALATSDKPASCAALASLMEKRAMQMQWVLVRFIRIYLSVILLNR